MRWFLAFLLLGAAHSLPSLRRQQAHALDPADEAVAALEDDAKAGRQAWT